MIPLNDDETEDLVKDIRKNLAEKKISNYDAFNLLDKNKDGFITYDEYSNEIN